MLEEEERYKYARPIFDKLPDDLKVACEELATAKILVAGGGGLELQTPFAWRDGVTGRIIIDPHYARILPRLVKEWRTKEGKTRE